MAKSFLRFSIVSIAILLLTHSSVSLTHDIQDTRIGQQNDSWSQSSGSLIGSIDYQENLNETESLWWITTLKLLIFIYCCLAIALVCDEYFVPSIEQLGEALQLPSGITSSILIPFGISGPEIFVSGVSVLFTKDDIGSGAVIGSAVFNLLAIPSACGFAVSYFIKKSILLDGQSILRDLLFYTITIIVLILTIKDNRIDIVESMMMVLVAIIYISVMIYSAYQKPKEQRFNCQICKSIATGTWNNNHFPTRRASVTITIEGQHNQSQENLKENINHNLVIHSHSQGNYKQNLATETTALIKSKSTSILHTQFTESTRSSRRFMINSHRNDDLEDDDDDDEDNETFIMKNPILKIILFPVSILFKLTIPRRWILLTFSLSIIWLGLLSWLTVESISSFSQDLKIPEVIAGMTIVVAGSAIPDLITSIIIVKRNSLASVGICAAIASNVYAVLIGLGIPWLIQSIINWVTFHRFEEAQVIIESIALSVSSYMMLIVIIIYVVVLKSFSWQINYKLSLICLSLYIMFLAIASLLEFNFIS